MRNLLVCCLCAPQHQGLSGVWWEAEDLVLWGFFWKGKQKTWRVQDLLLLECKLDERLPASTCMHMKIQLNQNRPSLPGKNKQQKGQHNTYTFGTQKSECSSQQHSKQKTTRRLFLGFLIEITFLHKTNSVSFQVSVKQETIVVTGHFYNPQLPAERNWEDILFMRHEAIVKQHTCEIH